MLYDKSHSIGVRWSSVNSCTLPVSFYLWKNKKLSYRRETAHQLPTWRGARPSAHSPYAPSGYTYAYGRIQNPQQTYVKCAIH